MIISINDDEIIVPKVRRGSSLLESDGQTKLIFIADYTQSCYENLFNYFSNDDNKKNITKIELFEDEMPMSIYTDFNAFSRLGHHVAAAEGNIIELTFKKDNNNE